MAIKDLQAREGNVDLIGTITEVGDTKEFEKFGKTGRVSSATMQDETGTVKLSLWNEQIDQVKVGDKVHVQKGYVNEFKGELQLTTGKFGTLEVLESGVEAPKPAPTAAPAPPEKAEPVEEPSSVEEGVEEETM